MDLIRRQDAIDAIASLASTMSVCESVDECHGMKRMQSMAVITLHGLPSAEPRKGKWIRSDEDDGDYWECSECGFELNFNGCIDPEETLAMYNFCPNCGAAMRGDTNESN